MSFNLKSSSPDQPGQSCGRIFLALVAGVFAVFLVGAIFSFWTGEKGLGDYPGGSRSELTSVGNKFIDSLYKNNRREGSEIKVFLTGDKPEQIFNYYSDQLVTRGGYSPVPQSLTELPGAIIIAFSKKDLTNSARGVEEGVCTPSGVLREGQPQSPRQGVPPAPPLIVTKDLTYLFITSQDYDNLVKGQQTGQSYIIIAQGHF